MVKLIEIGIALPTLFHLQARTMLEISSFDGGNYLSIATELSPITQLDHSMGQRDGILKDIRE